MRNGWKNAAIGNVCTIRPPKRESKKILNGEDLVSFVPMDELCIRQKAFTATQARPLDKVYGGYTYFAEDDVLLAKITPCFQNGKLGIARGLTNGVGFGSSEFFVLRCNGNLDPEFLFHFLSQNSFTTRGVAQMTGAVGHKRVPLEFIENHSFPLPPLAEQKRIVAILDEAFAGIATAVANAEKNLANARELFKSHLNAVFSQRGDGWVETTIDEHIRFIDYRGRTPRKTESGMRLITAKNVKMGHLQEHPMEFVDPAIYKEWMTRGIPQKGDVLFTTEAPLGNVAQLDTSEMVVFAQRVIIMQPDHNHIVPDFLKFMLLSRVMQRSIHDRGTDATAKGIKASRLKKVDISFPGEIEEQRQIVRLLDRLQSETQRLESIYQQKLDALAELKQSILQKAFAGELTSNSKEVAA